MNHLRIGLGLLFLSAWLFPSAQADVLFEMGSNWKYFKGKTGYPSGTATEWRETAFDDSAWAAGPTPIYYGEPLTGTLIDDMRYTYSCIFLRKAFVLQNPLEISQLKLDAICDDGFVAWLNGHEVARYNVPDGEIAFNGFSFSALSEPIPWETYPLDSVSAFLVEGTNVMAIQLLNCNLTSSDIVFDATLSAPIDVTPPFVAVLSPAAGSTVRTLTSIEVDFSEPVGGLDATDLLINGAATTNATLIAPGQYVFEFAQPPTGTVQVAWAPGHGIHDLSPRSNPFTGDAWSYQFNPSAPIPGVMISEFLAANDKSIRDADGDHSDWIELYNATTASVSLDRWCLSNDSTVPDLWRFPRVSIPSKGYLVLFASGKNRTNATAALHTNFKLDKAGGFLGLYSPDLKLVSGFSPLYPKQYTDTSYGRDTLAPEVLGYFTQPTPGAKNVGGGPDFAPEVEFSRKGGTFLNAFALTLATPNTNAVIRYTVDRSVPTLASLRFTVPLQITNSVQVRARAFVSGLLPGPIQTESYLSLNSTVVNFTSDLPLVIVHTFGGGSIPADTKQAAYIAVFEPRNGRSSLTNAPDTDTRAGINLRGSSTLGYPKHSLSVEFWNDYDEDKHVGLLGMPAESDWVFYAPNNFEPVMIHNPFMHDLSRQVGRYSPRTRFAEVYINKTGGPVTQANYFGIYAIEERIKRGKDRVDVDSLEPEHTTPPSITGGYVMKVDRWGPNDSGFWSSQLSILFLDPKGPEMDLPQRAPQRQYIQNYFDTCYTVLNGADWTDPVKGYAAYIDVDAAIDDHLLNVLAFNVDAYRLSGFLYKPRNGKITFGPLWDFDRTLGSTDGRDAAPRRWRSAVPDYGTDFFNPDPIYPNSWYGRMSRDIDFWQKWVDRYQELRASQFSLTNLYSLVDSLTRQLREAQPRDTAKWGVAPRGGSYQAEINLMKQWLSNRVDFMDTNFVARPAPDRPAGQVPSGPLVNFTAKAPASIFYTLDGSDPRLPGGGISPKATPLVGSVTITANARLVARALDPKHKNLTGVNNPPLSTSWSGPIAATYVVQTPALAITELMYDPEPPLAGSTNSASDFEYVELRNVGTNTLDLAGFHLSGGVDYTFTAASAVTQLQPGEYVLVAKNLMAFNTRYPQVGRVAGEYSGSLNKGGERIILEGPLKEPIFDFVYSPDWYPITHGPGFSLVVRDDTAAFASWATPDNLWASTDMGGSPGRIDPTPHTVPAVLVNEALTHTDLPQVDTVELFNPNPIEVDIGGWFLSDDFRTPRKYAIPGGTRIPAGGFALFDETQFGTATTNSFGLSAFGDELYLFSGDGATLTGYSHGFHFGAAARGVTFGRYVTSTGAEHFVAQVRASLGQANAGPLVGPVVISEIHYNPAPVGTNVNTLDEFVELANITAQAVPLYDTTAPTNCWRVGGGIEFHFPTNASLLSGGVLLLVNFDPVLNSAAADRFRSLYNVDPQVRIFGPYGGNLNNAGDRVAIYKPEPSETELPSQTGDVPYVLVDEAAYSPAAPWPADADGTGKSLHRIDGGAYGNDPANWMAASPTAGATGWPPPLLDTDGDGMPDAWESAHYLDPKDPSGANGAGGDPDGDGMTNAQEYAAGTDPSDPTSSLRVDSVTVEGTTVTLRFRRVAGRSYSVLECDDLAAGAWVRLRDIPATDQNENVAVNDQILAGSGGRYYRIVTPASTPAGP